MMVFYSSLYNAQPAMHHQGPTLPVQATFATVESDYPSMFWPLESSSISNDQFCLWCAG